MICLKLSNFLNEIRVLFFFFILLTLAGCNAGGQAAKKGTDDLQFKKHQLTSAFIAEGIAVGDVDHDGKTDIMSGAYWFKAPDWSRMELARPDSFIVNGGYSNSFLNFSLDVNQDGWEDYIRIDFPGKPAVWHENPKNKPGHWPVHTIYKSVGNESPMFVEIDADGRPDLLCNDPDDRQVIWLKSPSVKGDTTWTKTIISTDTLLGVHMYTHGIGFGDINGDGKKDVIINKGWWESPQDPSQENWTFHPGNLGEDCAQMYALDVDLDGDNDVISSSAHKYGIWWHEQVKKQDGAISWVSHLIDSSHSQTHGLALEDINGDKHPDLITGKRYYAHHGQDPGAEQPAKVYWYAFKPGKTPTWTRHEVDTNSGLGLQVVIEDMNKDGYPDILGSNKKGVFYFERINAKKSE